MWLCESDTFEASKAGYTFSKLRRLQGGGGGGGGGGKSGGGGVHKLARPYMKRQTFEKSRDFAELFHRY